MRKRCAAVGFFLLAALPPLCRIQAQDTPDPWLEFRALIGLWSGNGEGFGTTSTVSHSWEFIIDDTFLRLETRSVGTAAGGSQEQHEDVGYLSFDRDRRRFVFRQFLSEGYVNTYDVTFDNASRRTIDFAHRESESSGGMRARMSIVFKGDDEYEMVLDLANPGEDFVACQWMRMKRARGGD